MSSNRVGFGEGTLKSTETLIADAKVELKRLDLQMQGNLSSALQGRFGGQAATAFSGLNRAWSEKYDRIVKTLERFEASLSETERSMTVQDTSVSDGVNAIANAMGETRDY